MPLKIPRGGCRKIDSLPVAQIRLEKLAKDACTSTFESVMRYDHSQTQEWTNKVMDHMLAALVPDAEASTRSFKFVVTCSIIQHTASVPPPQPAYPLVSPESVTIDQFYTKNERWPHSSHLTSSDKYDLLGPAARKRGELPQLDAATLAAEEAAEQIACAEAMEFQAKRHVPGRLPRAMPSTIKVGPEDTVGRTGRYFALKASWSYQKDGVWECTWDGGPNRDFDVIICVIYIQI
ncbi:MAG: hypothetical protein Q9187_007375 [Circinaria calcarea]